MHSYPLFIQLYRCLTKVCHYSVATLRQWAWLVLLACSSLPAAAQSPPSPPPAPIALDAQAHALPIGSLSQYWVDDSGKATIEQVASSASSALFAPRRPAQRHSIDGKALWIRFDAAALDTRSRWFLEVGLPTADDITLYWRDTSNQWVTNRAGDVVPRAQWPVRDRFPVFQLNPERAPTQYYVRIVHDRVPFAAPLHIYRDTALAVDRQNGHFFLGMYFGLTLLVFVACIVMALTVRDNSFTHYAVYVLSMGLGQASFTGLAAQYLWPGWPWWVNASSFFLLGLTTATCLWFTRSAVQLRVFFPRLDLLALLLAAAQLAVLVVDVLHPSVAGFHLINAITLAGVLLVGIAVWYAWTRGDAPLRWIALGLTPVLLGVLPLLLRNAQLIDPSFFTQYGVMLGSAVEMPILLYGLMRRTAARREGRARAAGLPTHDALTGLLNTRELLRHIHGAMTRAARSRQQYCLILVELSNHAWFAREHGREMGDHALILLANRLQYIARDVDSAARIDDNHFVVLVEGPCTPGLAAKVAAQISASARRPSNLLPVGAALKLRITCALMPDPKAQELGDDAQAQLAWLVDSAESLPREAQKTVRTLNF